MRNVSYLVALIGGLFLVAAAVAGWRILRKPDEEPPTEKNKRRANFAGILIGVALLLSAVAAIVAVLGWFKR